MKRLVYFISLCLFSCNQPQDKPQTPTYFPLKAFMEQQIALLSAQKPLLNKMVEAEGQSDTTQTTAVDWTKELDLFVQADLNKPAYINSYTVSNEGNTTRYVVKNGESLPTQFLKITRDPVTQQPITVEALSRTENYLFTSQKQVSLVASINKDGKWRLAQYRIEGFQQLIFGSKKPFKIVGILSR